WQEQTLEELKATGLRYPPIQPSILRRYWMILYLPLIIVPCIVALFERRRRARMPSWITRFASTEVGLVPFCIGAFLCVFPLLLVVTEAGLWSNVLGLPYIESDYPLSIQMRYEAFGALSDFSFGLIYTGLPTLCHVAMFAWFRRRSAAWFVACAATFAITIVMLTVTVQK